MSLFTAAIALSSDGTGAFVVFEKIPRKTERTRDAWHDGIREKEPIYECSARLVGAEQLTGSLPTMVAHIVDRLKAEPLVDDTMTRIDVGASGHAVLELFRIRGSNPWPTIVGGEKETTDPRGTRTLPIATLQAMATVMLETSRVEIANGLVEGPSVLLALSELASLPDRGPARDLGIAAAVALYLAATTGGGAWPSSKPRPPAMLEDEARRAWERKALHESIKLARRSRGQGDDW